MKITATTIKSDLEPSVLQTTLLTQGNKSVNVEIKGKTFGIVEVGVHEGDAVLMAEEGQKGVKASWLAKELNGIKAEKVFIEYGGGKMIPALDVKNNTIIATSVHNKKIGKLEAMVHKLAEIVTGRDMNTPAISMFTGETSKKASFFDDAHPSFNGLPTVVGPSSMGSNHHGYIAYDPKSDKVQLGVLNGKLEPISEFIEEGKLRHLDWIIGKSAKYRIEFDDDALSKFREHVSSKTERRASQLKSKPVYAYNFDKESNLHTLFVGEYQSKPVRLITSSQLAEEGEIEINWGGDERCSEDYEYVSFKECPSKVKELIGINLNLDDKSWKKVCSMYPDET